MHPITLRERILQIINSNETRVTNLLRYGLHLAAASEYLHRRPAIASLQAEPLMRWIDWGTRQLGLKWIAHQPNRQQVPNPYTQHALRRMHFDLQSIHSTPSSQKNA